MRHCRLFTAGCSTPVSLPQTVLPPFISRIVPRIVPQIVTCRLLHADCPLPPPVFIPARSRTLVNSLTYIDICYRAHLVDRLRWGQRACQRESCGGRDKGTANTHNAATVLSGRFYARLFLLCKLVVYSPTRSSSFSSISVSYLSSSGIS